MLFLALPPADMLPPAGHRAGPGRAHTGPIARSGWPGGRPGVLLSAGAAAAEAKAALQSRSNSSSCPRPPRSSRPTTGGRGRGLDRDLAGTSPKSQCGRNPGLESERQGGLECPGTPGKFPGASRSPCPRLNDDAQPPMPNLGAHGAPHAAGGCR